MAQLGIREYDAKQLMAKFLPKLSDNKIIVEDRQVLIFEGCDLKKTEKENSWLKKTKLVLKPDQLFGKRGKHGLVWLNLDWNDVKKIFKEKLNKEVMIGKAKGKLTHFLIEPFIPHKEEFYISMTSERDCDVINFSTQGGVDIEAVWDSVKILKIKVTEAKQNIDFEKFLGKIDNKAEISLFIKTLYKFFVDFNFAYFEINPFTLVDGKVIPLDCVAKLDNTGVFESGHFWGNIEFPKPFGRTSSKEEQYIENLDANTGASLKLTILNLDGRVWPMVAGGGASVIYADTVADLGFGNELACYGEYSGGPSTEETESYASTILDLMTRKPHPKKKRKILLIGGGIANFTDVAATFKGIILALNKYAKKLKDNNVKIYVRRGGPNYKEGLNLIKKTAEKLGLDMEVYGPETHMTKIVSMALGD
ncbi:MAG: ATP-citrate lyase subunit B [Candidatus Peregrinibacteria bacterium GW2011_GWF2_33_10]|nr:MAG: ATP-citrate lyase subunit B [Candidatus Peregrinibacteria bacterium GW2011_GWF2_33_10]OGJ44519.1 MAG: ATPase [Candidatus Peregrinibacteria bacterium RIFOXYA2_FULL_33_21]OGJ46755.1 MAG: ATPase [Candidatus Peregrinibacteria bacterium RIFOXYA12_FULL_33_12]OGJ50327.1 MAG: ATPase [Candidatus Peregrinibacteria bacterium RIFOXYB2_FULL_33_20]